MTDFNEQDDGLLPVETDEPMSMTLSSIGRGDNLPDDGEFEPASTSDKNLLSHSAILIAVVAVVAIGSLYIMRATQGDLTVSKEAQEVEAKIANTLDRLNMPSLLQSGDPLLADNLNDLLASTDEVIAIFGHDVREQQVPIEEVKKDPFSLASQQDENSNTNIDNTNQQNDRRHAKLNKELAKLDLQSIMMGARNIAVIGGEFYKQGDRVGSFTVAEIDKLTITLDAAGFAFELRLQTNQP